MAEQNDVQQQAVEWGMHEHDGSVTPAAMTAAAEYMQYLHHGSNYAIQIMFAFSQGGMQGVMLLCSTPESCAQDNENTQRIAQNLQVFRVGWMLFHVWWYPGLQLLNFRGMTDFETTGGVSVGTVEQVFDAEWRRRDQATWQLVYGIPRPGEEYYGMLFNMLRDLGIPFFILATSGYSWREYRALDVYLRPFVFGQPPPAQEAWYVVNTERPWYHRTFLRCDDWYLCHHYVSWGQRDSLLNQRVHQRYSILPPPSSM